METRPPFSAIFSSLSDSFSQVLGKQAELLQTEMGEKASFAVRGLVKVALGSLLMITGVMVLVASAILALAIIMPAWLATLIVAVVLLLIGRIILAIGLGSMKTINLKPERTISSVKETVRAVREGWQT